MSNRVAIFRILFWSAFAFGLLVEVWADDPAFQELDYNRDVRKILAERCFACHGPDEEHRQADLRLDVRQHAIEAGVLLPTGSAASELVRRLETANPDEVMPPPESGELTEHEKDVLRNWIQQGAEYQKHWAFEAVVKPELPRAGEDSWCPNPIDHFIVKRLLEHELHPSVQAHREILIKRVYLDLIGLLPTPAQVSAFVKDESPDAYESVVDELLRSKHFGERWGRHWLDQARYADSNGYTFDNPRVMWPYRDWVIKAINDDMPFDEFTIQQLAGDLFPEPTIEQLVATGFHRNTLINEEGGTDAEQFRVESVIDRTNTTGTVWLALTVGCAQCHNHKFDPVSQQDYFSLFAFFNNTADRNNRGPEVTVQSPHADEIAELERQLAELANREKKQAENELVKPEEWTVLSPLESKAESNASFALLEDQSLLVSGPNEIEDTYEIVYQLEKGPVAAFRLNVLPHESLPKGGPGRAGNGNFVMVDVRFEVADGKQIPLEPVALADYSQSGYGISLAVDSDLKSGWAINTNQKGNVAHWAKFLLSEPAEFQKGELLRLRMRFNQGRSPYNLGRFQLLSSSTRPAGADVIAVRRDALQARKKTLEAARVKAMVMRELEQPRVTHLLTRGDFLRPAQRVESAVLNQLHPLSELERPLTRLDLAHWLVDSDNPLTPRVAVNRMWQKLFGVGLVETVEDFGVQGSVPSHPKLLDWLAAEFVERGWSRKQMLRLIVTSSTYRQASTTRADLDRKDPMNQLLGRQNRLRVDAEIVRDLALSASGKLSPKIGGPSVYPPQPAGVYAFTQKKKNWPTSEGEDRFRRTMYTFFYRSSPHPMLTAFDTPRFNVTCTRRGRSNTPLQSLMVANDPGLFELAEALAERTSVRKGDLNTKLHHMFRLALCRTPSTAELQYLKDFVEEQRLKFDKDEVVAGASAEQYALTAAARVLMNLDEFITRE